MTLIHLLLLVQVPGKPEGLAVRADPLHPRVTISWSAPTSPNGVIIRYTLYYHYLPNGNWTKIASEQNTFSVTVNIIGGLNYQFEVSATTVEEGPKAKKEVTIREYGKCNICSLINSS